MNVVFQCDHTGQPHRQTGRVDIAVIFGDDRHPVEKNGLDRVLPGPERERKITEGENRHSERSAGAKPSE